MEREREKERKKERKREREREREFELLNHTRRLCMQYTFYMSPLVYHTHTYIYTHTHTHTPQNTQHNALKCFWHVGDEVGEGEHVSLVGVYSGDSGSYGTLTRGEVVGD